MKKTGPDISSGFNRFDDVMRNILSISHKGTTRTREEIQKGSHKEKAG